MENALETSLSPISGGPTPEPRTESAVSDWLGFGRGSCRVVASLSYWGARSFASLVAGLPVATLLAAHVRGYENGDQNLFEAGGMLLLDAILQHSEALGAAVEVAFALWAIGLGLGFVTMTSVVGALAGARHATLESWAGRTAHAFPRMLVLSLLGWLGRGALAFVGFLLISLSVNLGDTLDDEKMRGLCVAVGVLIAALLVVVVQPWCDLGRARAAAVDEPPSRSARWAWRLLRRRAGSTFGSWTAAAGGGVTCLAVAAASTPAFITNDPSALQTVLMIVIQQLGFAGATACRLAWLSKAAVLARPERGVV